MEQLSALLAAAAFFALWTWFLYKRSDGRWWSPLWLSFSAGAAAALFLVSGFIGYILSKRARFAAGTAWSDAVIWWEVGVGVALMGTAVYLWRKGVRQLAR